MNYLKMFLPQISYIEGEEGGAAGGSTIDPDALLEAEGNYEKPVEKDLVEGDKPQGDTKPLEGDKKPSEGSEISLKYKFAFEQLKENGVDISDELLGGKLPEGKTEEEVLREYLKPQRNTEGTFTIDQLHPEALRLHNMLAEGKKLEEYVSQVQDGAAYLQLPNREFMEQYYKNNHLKTEDNPIGLTEEEISEELDAMEERGGFALTAIELKKKEAARIEKENAAKEEKLKKMGKGEEQAPISYEEKVKIINKAIDTLYEDYVPNVTDINGLKVSKADMDNFRNTFQELVTPDKETGKPAVNDLIVDDKALFNLLYLATDGGKRIRSILNDTKTETKSRLINRLGLEPIVDSKDGGQKKNGVIDAHLLTEPEGAIE